MMLLKRLLSKIYRVGAVMFPPAKEDDIRLLRLTLARHKLPTLPMDYVQFLNLTDGLLWNGMQFYGVQAHNRDNLGYTLPGLLEVNMDYASRKRRQDFLVLGEVDEDLIVYAPKEKTYQLVDKMDLLAELNLPRFFDVVYLFSEDLVKEDVPETSEHSA